VTISKKGNYTSFNTHFSWLSEYAGPLLIQCVWRKLYSIQALSLVTTSHIIMAWIYLLRNTLDQESVGEEVVLSFILYNMGQTEL
jgi:hypothetical protein